MLEALYNIALLVETGAATYLTSKAGIDFAWQKALEFFVNNDLLNEKNVSNLVNGFEKVEK